MTWRYVAEMRSAYGQALVEVGPVDSATEAMAMAIDCLGMTSTALVERGGDPLTPRPTHGLLERFVIRRFSQDWAAAYPWNQPITDAHWSVRGRLAVRCQNPSCDDAHLRWCVGQLDDSGFCDSCAYNARRSGEDDVSRAHRVVAWQERVTLGLLERQPDEEED